MNWIADFKENAIYRLRENQRMIHIACDKLVKLTGSETDKLIWKKPVSMGNSLGNQLLHICGNMTQYGIASLGEKEDTRNRDDEFETQSGFSLTDLLEKLDVTIEAVIATIEQATGEQLLKKRNVQGFNFSGLGCVMHLVEHASYHTGQIAFWVKQLSNSDLGFYDGLDLTVTNDE